MIYLSRVSKNKTGNKSYPFSVPSIKTMESINFSSPITFLVGENGSGKSTFLEGLACAINSHTIGERPLEKDGSLAAAQLLSTSFKLTWKIRTHKGFFVRSEDVFGFTKYLSKTKEELNIDAKEFAEKFTGYGQKLALGAVLGQRNAFENRYGQDLDANSHGETFLKIFKSRFVPGGLYLLDEPETPLSFNSQLALVLLLREMVQKDAQFIIATHSPILASLPEAGIFSFDEGNIRKIKYEEIGSFRLMRDFLNHPEAFLNHL